MARKQKCLMIQTKDKRKFFTHEKNYSQLVEFGKTFRAELSIVRAEDPPVLDLISLAPALCDKSYKLINSSFEIVEVKLAYQSRPRKELRRQAKVIRKWIKKKLLEGRSVRLADIANRYPQYQLTLSCFCTHFAAVRKELETEGKHFKKIKHGEYKIE